MSRNISRLSGLIVLVFLLGACDKPANSDARGGLPIPPKGFVADVSQGAQLFRDNCASCHGHNAYGSVSGPPLIHRIYAPDHHADLAFFMAAKNGTRQHHWQFGDMPPVPAVAPEQVAHIVAYIRAEQRRAGIYN